MGAMRASVWCVAWPRCKVRPNISSTLIVAQPMTVWRMPVRLGPRSSNWICPFRSLQPVRAMPGLRRSRRKLGSIMSNLSMVIARYSQIGSRLHMSFCKIIRKQLLSVDGGASGFTRQEGADRRRRVAAAVHRALRLRGGAPAGGAAAPLELEDRVRCQPCVRRLPRAAPALLPVE